MHDDAREPGDGELPLGPLQAGMLFQALLAPSGGFDVEQVVVRLNEPIDVRALIEAWRIAGSRHDALRLRFRWAGLEQPTQTFLDAVEPDVLQHDWTTGARADGEARLADLLAADRRRGFDLTRPPWRVHVCQLEPERAVMVWSLHHLILDGRSFVKVLLEVFDDHAALRAHRTPTRATSTRSMEDVLRARSARAPVADDAEFWRALLSSRHAPTALPFAEPASKPLSLSGAGEATILLDAGTTAGLHALAVSCGAGMPAVVHALWAVLLSRWSCESDVVFGSTRSTRRGPPREDALGVVGMFINTFPMRVAVDDERTVHQLVTQLRQQAASLRDHQQATLVGIAQQAGLPGGVPLFETIVMFDAEEVNDALRAADPSWQTREVAVLEQPAAALVLTAFDGPRLKLRLLYQRGRVRDQVADRIIRHLDVIARRLAHGPEQLLGAIDSMPDDERHTILERWNDTERPYADQLRIHQGFEARADAQPDAAAVVQGDVVLSYRALEEQANRLAHLLRARGAAPGVWVGLCVERTPSLVVALLAIAKSGAAYLPIDPEYPADRIEFMLQDSGAGLVVTEQALRTHFADRPCVVLDGDDRDALAGMPSMRPAPLGTSADTCYAIYTSGSTGRPKGVVLTHRAVVNTLDWVSRTFEVKPGDRLLFVTSPCFDLSVYDTFGALAAGATIEVARATELKDPAALAAKLTGGDVTIWDSAPQALQAVMPLLPERAQASRLRLVMLSGDWIPLALPPALQRVFPGVLVRSLGGATEAAIWSNWYPVGTLDPRWVSIPYGRPIQNARYHVLDRRMRPVPPGVPGNLYIGGTCLAQGYLNRADLTAERFVPDPFRDQEPDGSRARLYLTGDRARYFDDGNLEFLGRADFQVKVRGFRVELGEIESVLRQHSDVTDAVCVARKDASGEHSVWGFVTLRADGALDAQSAPAALRAALAARLPEFMVPAGVIVLDKMPMTNNGKLDRAALPDPASASGPRTVTAPRTALERQLVEMWVELLGRRPVGVDDNFFELGGHSLLAVHLITRLKRDLALEVPLSHVIEHPTIASLASCIECRGTSRKNHLVTLNGSGARPSLLLIPGIGGQVFTYHPLAARLGANQPLFAFTAIGMERGDEPRESIEAIAELYDRELAQSPLPAPLVIGGFSVGGLAAFELATRLVARGVDVRGLVLFDALAPGYPEPLPRLERAQWHASHVLRLKGAERREYLLARLHSVSRRALFRVGLGHLVAPKVDGADDSLDIRMRMLWARMNFARDTYVPRHRFDGPLLLFKAEVGFNWPATRMDDPAHGWGKFVTGKVSLATLKGNHERVFISENVDLMGAAIEGFISELASDATRS